MGTSTNSSRWAAVGAALAVTFGAGGILTTSASIDSGERAVYVPITPCRLFDTRPAPDTVGTRTAPLGPDETYAVQVRGTNGNCTIPADAVGLVMNVAVISPTDASFLAVFPSDAPTRPLAANANWLNCDPPLSNAVTADISADGRVSFYNLKGTVHVAADIVGYFVDHTHDDRYYTKALTDGALAVKANTADVYTKSQTDAAIAPKANSADVYTRAEADARFERVHQTISFNPFLVVVIGPAASAGISFVNDCATFLTGGVEGRLPLDLPLGWRIVAVQVGVLDAPGADQYTITLLRHARMMNGMTQDVLATRTGFAGSNLNVTNTLVPASPETVDAQETFDVLVRLGATASTNALCYVSVDLAPPA